jgi:hypothetical protein
MRKGLPVEVTLGVGSELVQAAKAGDASRSRLPAASPSCDAIRVRSPSPTTLFPVPRCPRFLRVISRLGVDFRHTATSCKSIQMKSE